jgi:hypothetical protein
MHLWKRNENPKRTDVHTSLYLKDGHVYKDKGRQGMFNPPVDTWFHLMYVQESVCAQFFDWYFLLELLHLITVWYTISDGEIHLFTCTGDYICVSQIDSQ